MCNVHGQYVHSVQSQGYKYLLIKRTWWTNMEYTVMYLVRKYVKLP